ncbi:MAG: hypothetical protein PHQ05_04850 [Sterolibacterium sp.]|nr:hypothetical protein [Sterolibacterium sp.]
MAIMPTPVLASTRAHRPLRAFSVTVGTEGQKLEFTALAPSKGQALAIALDQAPEGFAVCISVRPHGLPEFAVKRAGIHDELVGQLVYADVLG